MNIANSLWKSLIPFTINYFFRILSYFSNFLIHPSYCSFGKPNVHLLVIASLNSSNFFLAPFELRVVNCLTLEDWSFALSIWFHVFAADTGFTT